jgi:hypothetical protein
MFIGPSLLRFASSLGAELLCRCISLLKELPTFLASMFYKHSAPTERHERSSRRHGESKKATGQTYGYSTDDRCNAIAYAPIRGLPNKSSENYTFDSAN